MTTPCVSVCVVTYNHERYIHECIMSVLAQARDVSLEILVGDDLSTDTTEVIVRSLAEQFPKIVRYFRHPKNLGPSGNYQFLIREARGKYIAHLDGDDYWLPGKLLRQLSVLEESEDCVAAYTNAFCVSESGAFLGLFNNPVSDRFDINALLCRGNFVNHSSMVYRSSFSNLICSLSGSFIDYRIHLTLAQYGLLAYIETPCVVYRVNSSNSMVANQNEHVRELYWSAVREALETVEDESVRMAATACFLGGVFFRAREVGSVQFFLNWWRLVVKQIQCNRLRLALLVAADVIRRRSLSVLTKYCGWLAGFPFRIFCRR